MKNIKKITIVMGIILGAMLTQSFDLSPAKPMATNQQIIEYMEAHGLESIRKESLTQLSAAPTPPPPNSEHCISCSEISYCGLDSADLIQYIDNYRDSVWSKTSPYFNSNPYSPTVLFDGVPIEDEFDARFMDMDLAKLENYICTIKNSIVGKEVNTIRFYYIRYDQNNAPIPNFVWKHSLAMVPVQRNESGLTQAEYINPLIRTDGTSWSLAADVASFCANTPMANHSDLCPPLTGCIDGTLLEIADTN